MNDDTPIVGRIVERVESRGKWCLMYFSGSRRGRAPDPGHAHVDERKLAPVPPGRAVAMPRRQCGWWCGWTASAGDAGWEAVLFNAQIAEFHTARSLERSSQVPKLGPDVLAGDFTVEVGVARLEAYAREHPEAEVGVVLLNQRVLAGLGNVYKSEVAFAAGVNPWRRMRTVTRAEMERMVEFSLRYMKANVVEGKGDGIVTYTGIGARRRRMDKEERLWVYGRQGQECRRCGATIMMRKQGEQARSTYWCPECQPRWSVSERCCRVPVDA